MRESNAWFLLAKPVKSRVCEGYKKAFFGKGKKVDWFYCIHISYSLRKKDTWKPSENSKCIGRSIHGQEISKRYVSEVKSQGDCSFSSESQITYLLTKKTLKNVSTICPPRIVILIDNDDKRTWWLLSRKGTAYVWVHNNVQFTQLISFIFQEKLKPCRV